jgi:thioredoxin-related protein
MTAVPRRNPPAALCTLALSLATASTCLSLDEVTAVSSPGSGEWTEDFEAAKARAAKEKKDLLINFTGSDWCGWCIKLKKEVFDEEAFRKEAPKQFVLVELDYPQRKQQAPKVKEQNLKLQRQYAVGGFPRIFLADAEGRPYAITGYQPGGPEGFLRQLGGLRSRRESRDQLFEKAAKEEGLAKAQLLDEALKSLAMSLQGADVSSFYGAHIDEVIKLDARNEGGLRVKWELTSIAGLMRNRNVDQAAKRIDALLRDLNPQGEVRQEVLIFKAQTLLAAKDVKGAISVLEEAENLAPQSRVGLAIPGMIARIKSFSPPGGGN